MSCTFATQSRSASFIASFSVAAPLVTGTTSAPSSFMRNTLGCLPLHVVAPMKIDARQAEARADGRRGHAVLARAGFRDDPGLAHAHREQDLADAIVDLVRAGVVELVALEPHLRAAGRFLGQPGGEIERAGAADIVFQQIVELRLERRVGLCRRVMRSRSRISGISVSAT